MHDALDADRRKGDGCGERRAEDGRRQVALTDVAQEPGDDPPVVERRAVGALCPLQARTAGDVAEGFRREPLPRKVLELSRLARERRIVCILSPAPAAIEGAGLPSLTKLDEQLLLAPQPKITA